MLTHTHSQMIYQPLVFPLSNVLVQSSPPISLPLCLLSFSKEKGVQEEGEEVEAGRWTEMGIPTYLVPKATLSVGFMNGPVLS